MKLSKIIEKIEDSEYGCANIEFGDLRHKGKCRVSYTLDGKCSTYHYKSIEVDIDIDINSHTYYISNRNYINFYNKDTKIIKCPLYLNGEIGGYL